MSKDCYQTPPEVFAYMNAEFRFAIDVAASRQNAMCDIHISEAEDALSCNWMPSPIQSWAGRYAWCNPPYSDIEPWVTKAAEQSKLGIGTVMLVMMDQSVGWYKEAIKTCQEVRLVIGGRLSFINPETGKPAAGNNKGSMFLIWHPFGRTPVQYSHIDRDAMLATGRELSGNSGELPEHAAGTDIDDGTKPCVSESAENETQTDLSIQDSQQTHNWPVEVVEAVNEAFSRTINSSATEYRGLLCESANKMILNGARPSLVANKLLWLIDGLQEMENKSCAA